MTEEIQAQEPITAFKGFNKNLQCRGYQYEIGKAYKHEGEVEACASGFHSCEFPLDVFNYYAPAGSRFAIVTASGELSRHGSDSKVASAELTIQAEIGIPKLVEKAVEFIISKCDFSGAATNTGDCSAATNTGYKSAASVEGKHSVAISTGYKSKAKAGEAGAIVLVYRNDDCELIHIRASKVGENGIKPDVWYSLNADGEFVEFDE